MELKEAIRIMFSFLLFGLVIVSCISDKRGRQSGHEKIVDIKEQSDIDSVRGEYIDKEVEENSIVEDSVSHTFPTSYDYESEAYIYYHSQIGKFYNDSVFNLYYPNRLQSLDSLIKNKN